MKFISIRTRTLISRYQIVAASTVFIAVALSSCLTPKQAVNPNALIQQKACIENIDLGDYTRAKARCQLCLEYDDQVPECINGLGIIAYAQGNEQSAKKYFRKALQLNSDFAQARNNLGVIYFKNGKFDEALPLFKNAVQINPGYEDGRYNLALTHLRLGERAMRKGDNEDAKAEYQAAQTQYQMLMELFPSFANVYRDMGLIKTYLASMQKLKEKEQADLAKASAYFVQCLKADPTNELCHESYGQTLLAQNQYDPALYQFVACLAANKKNAECIKGMDAAYSGSQIKSKALKRYLALIKKNPADGIGHYGYCAALFEKGFDKLAALECETAVKLNPKLCLAYYELGMYYKQALNAKKADSNCRSFIYCDGSKKDSKKVAQCKRVIEALAE